MSDTTLDRGDVICVRTKGWFGRLIRFWTTSGYSHTAVVHHVDAAGTWWVIEGRPEGVGWRTLGSYQKASYRLVHNADQPKTPEQRALIVENATALVERPYDWSAIARIGMERLDDAGAGWKDEWDGQRPPTHVICSSLAAYLYATAELPGPHSVVSTPDDWGEFIAARGWE